MPITTRAAKGYALTHAEMDANLAAVQALVSGGGSIGPVAVSGTPSSGQVVVASGPTAAAWGNVSGATSAATYPPLVALEAKLATIAQGVSALAKVLVIGDSVSGDISIPLLRPMVRAYGNAGIVNGSEQIGWTTAMAGGTAVTTSDDFTKWPGGRWTNIPAAGTLQYNNNGNHATDYPLPAGGVYRVGYLTTPGGGTFSVQDSIDGAAWTTLTTIDTNAAQGVSFASVAGTAGRRYLRLLGVTGTCSIVSYLVGSSSGYRQSSELSIGGSILANYMTCPSAIWDSYLSSAAPDLIFVYFKDDVDAAYLAALPLLQARILANCPNADVVYIGPTNSQASDPGYTPAPTTAQNDSTNRAAIAAHVAQITGMRAYYWDASKVWGTWAQANALGLMTDSPHPNDYGRLVLCERFCNDFSLFSSPTANTPWKISATALAFSGAFLATGGTISGQTRVSNTGDLQSSVTEANDTTAAARVAGALHVGLAIRTDRGFAIGSDLAATSSMTLAKDAGNSSWILIGTTLQTSSLNTNGNYGWYAGQGYLQVNHSGTATNSGNGTGLFGYVRENGSGTGLIANLRAMYAFVELSGAHPVTDVEGLRCEVQSYGSGSVTNMYGVRVVAFKGGTSVVTNGYGVYLPSNWNTIGTTQNWGFYNASTAASYSAGPWTWKPAASATPANNGDLTFEATSNTSVTVKLKGSDGTVRSAVLTLA